MFVRFKKFSHALLIANVLAALLSMQAIAAPVDTCVNHTPYGVRYLVVIGDPDHAQAVGEDATCFASNPVQPRYLVAESSRSGEERSIIDVSGVSVEDLNKLMDSASGSYYR